MDIKILNVKKTIKIPPRMVIDLNEIQLYTYCRLHGLSGSVDMYTAKISDSKNYIVDINSGDKYNIFAVEIIASLSGQEINNIINIPDSIYRIKELIKEKKLIIHEKGKIDVNNI